MRRDSEAALDGLMARLARGERAAFEPLFRELHPRALRLARTHLDPSSADDAAQSALLKVFARASEFTPGRAALPWFYALVANEIRSVRRGVRRREPLNVEELGAADPEQAEATLLETELSRALEAAVAALDDPAAEAIRFVLGRSERPELPSATFRKRVSRAYARLRVLLGDYR